MTKTIDKKGVIQIVYKLFDLIEDQIKIVEGV